MNYIKNKHITIPLWFFDIKYNNKITPDEKKYNLIETGSNCQVFAYELLRYNKLFVPNYRSSELWSDIEYSRIIFTNFKPLDILFFNKTDKPFGAHLGVYIGNDNIVHNSKKIGKPIVWKIGEFLMKSEYKVFIGGKRFQKTIKYVEDLNS